MVIIKLKRGLIFGPLKLFVINFVDIIEAY